LKNFHFNCAKFVRELSSTSKVALASVNLVKKLIGESRWFTANDLLHILKEEEKNLLERIPSETIVMNIWRRVIKIIKDESCTMEQSNYVAQTDTLQGNLFASIRSNSLQVPHTELKPIMIEAISEIKNEIETSIQSIASQAVEHIHDNQVVLTLGKSETVEAFLKVKPFQIIDRNGTSFYLLSVII
jgi:translation initiation factor eIF-2B subunit beta